MRQFTTDEAIAFSESGEWESLTARGKAELQMLQDKLCMPFDEFHIAIEMTLGRPVYTHEFGLNHEGLLKELFDGAPPPTLDNIIEMIPEDKRIIVIQPDD